MIRIVLLAILILIPQKGNHPRFEDYNVPKSFKGRPARVNLSSHPLAKRFRSVLNQGEARGPNFADQFTIVRWGCGSNCIMFAIIDAQDGRVFVSPEPIAFDLLYRKDSRLLIVDPIDSLSYESSGGHAPLGILTRYFLWQNHRLVQIDSTDKPIDLEYRRGE
jgi:hypothetical protein